MTAATALRAQQKAMPVIGFLDSTSPGPDAPFLAAFHHGLSETGHVEGQNVAIEYRWAGGSYDRLFAMAADLVSRQVDVIAADAIPAARAAKNATTTIPIVFEVGADPVEFGLVASFARPGGNLTGVGFLNVELMAKRLELLSELVPQAGAFVLLVNPTNENAERAFAQAAHVVGLETAINRVTGVPMELRAAVGVYDETLARYTVYTSAGGGVVRQRDDIAAVLRVPAAAVRVISGDVGGNFGIRNNTYPELALVAWAARRIGRPVKWTCERRDGFATDFHGRDLTSEAELALDKDGRFLAIRAVNTSNLGASAISFVPLAKGIAVSSSVYDIPCSYMRGRAVVTNTSPTSAYRSAGRPEVAFVLERLIDIACRRHGFDRIEIRRRNLVAPEAMPYRNPLGLVYDSGDYPAIAAAAHPERVRRRRARGIRGGAYRTAGNARTRLECNPHRTPLNGSSSAAAPRAL
jgi:hypothetical protein